MSIGPPLETDRLRTNSLFGICASRMKSAALPYSQDCLPVVPLRQVKLAPSKAQPYNRPSSVSQAGYLRQDPPGSVGLAARRYQNGRQGGTESYAQAHRVGSGGL